MSAGDKWRDDAPTVRCPSCGARTEFWRPGAKYQCPECYDVFSIEWVTTVRRRAGGPGITPGFLKRLFGPRGPVPTLPVRGPTVAQLPPEVMTCLAHAGVALTSAEAHLVSPESAQHLVRAGKARQVWPPPAPPSVELATPPPMVTTASTEGPNPVAAPSEAPAPELTPTQKEIVQAMSLMKAFGPDHPVTKDMIAERSGAGNGVGENIKKLMTSLKEKGVVKSSGSGRGPKSGYWLTELGRNLGEALPRPKR